MALRALRIRHAMSLHRLLKDHRGGGAVEFAFAGPIAILLTLGAVEAARAVSAQAAITQAAKATARFASVRGTASGAEASQDQLEAMALQLADLPASETTAAVSWDPDNGPGGTVTIQLQHDFTTVTIPFDRSMFTFNATASMTIVR
jgi:Flp pilus assembly protein TadG